MLIQQPHGRCMVSDLEKVELVRTVLDEDTVKHQHLWYVGFCSANSQLIELRCFESKMADHLLFPCVEVTKHAIKHDYTELFIVRTSYSVPFNMDVEDMLVNDVQQCCRYGGLVLNDYIVLKPEQHAKHRLRELALLRWAV